MTLADIKHNDLKFSHIHYSTDGPTTLTMVISCERCDQAVCLPQQSRVKSHWAFYKWDYSSAKSVLVVLYNSKDFNATELFP